MIEPAIANEEISTPKSPRRGSPINRKSNMIPKAISVVFPGNKAPVFDLISRIIGMEPRMSIMANRTIKAASISRMLRCMIKVY